MRYELNFDAETPRACAGFGPPRGSDLEASDFEGSDFETSDFEGSDFEAFESEGGDFGGAESEAPAEAYARAAGVEPYCREYGRWLQQSLNKILGLNLTDDGVVGEGTRNAIRRFRKERGLGDSGRLDLKLEAALVGAGAQPPPLSYPPPRPGARGVAAWVRGLLPLLEKYRGDIPLDFLVGWVAVESGGCVGVVTKEPYDERGYFQIHRKERANKKIRVDGREIERLRLSHDHDYSVRAGIELVRHYAREVERVYRIRRDSPLFWRMVKFMHTGSGYVEVVWKDMVAHGGGPPKSWDAIREHVDNFWNNLRLRRHKFFRERDPRTLVANVDKLFEKARQLLPQADGGGTSQELHTGDARSLASNFELDLEAEPFEISDESEFSGEFDETTQSDRESFYETEGENLFESEQEGFYELSDELESDELEDEFADEFSGEFSDEFSGELEDEWRRRPARVRAARGVRRPKLRPKPRPRPSKPPRRPRPRPRPFPVAFRVPAGSLNIFPAPRNADAPGASADAEPPGPEGQEPHAPAPHTCTCATSAGANGASADAGVADAGVAVDADAASDAGAGAEPDASESEFEEWEWLDPEMSEEFGDSFEWMEEVSRSSPDYVRWLQQSLNKVLGLRLAADGVSGAQTRSAVRSFQQRQGLQADGTMGAATERALVSAGATPPPASGASPAPAAAASAAASGLVKRESSPPSQTLYVRIPLGSESPAKPLTGIFIPQNFRPQAQADLIIYLHGFKTSSTLTIEGYWNSSRFPHFALREGLNDAGKNVVLVAPTLGARSQPGWLTNPGGFDKYVDQVLAALAAHGPHKEAGIVPRAGNIILACHSGGGLRMRQLALSGAGYAGQIKECWGFDCTYNRGDDTQWAAWARSRPDARLFVYYIANSPTQPLSLSLKRQQVPNVTVAASHGRGHNGVPIAHWRERIQAAAFLRPV
jgi:peptidoglycan hydrolase-like protein with peptidoglycan-binding domain